MTATQFTTQKIILDEVSLFMFKSKTWANEEPTESAEKGNARGEAEGDGPA